MDMLEQAVSGRVDRQGRLVSADPPLAGLQERAGGVAGGPLAVPQIAALAALAGKLGITVSRRVLAADGDDDLSLWVRAEPDNDGIDLSIAGWDRRQPPQLASASRAGHEHDFLRAAADWLWETDQALRLISVTGAGRSTTGDLERFIGQPLTGLFRFTEGKDGELPILNALAEHRRFEGQWAVLRTETAARVRLSAIPLIDGNGRFAGFCGTTEEIEAGPVTLEPNGAQMAAADMPDAFGKQLGQALRAPLDRIVANAESIQTQTEGPIRSDYAEYAGDIASAGRHLLALIEDLVDLQAVERDDFVPRQEMLDLADVARAAAGLLSVRASEKTIRIDRPADDEVLAATGDYRRVLQILVNLVGNAVRFAPADSQVWIRCEQEGDLAAVIVADQGRGIAADDQPRIFEKFERLSAEEPGSGLGLYIARRLARAMGGDITVDSAPGQGARFVLTLPLTP